MDNNGVVTSQNDLQGIEDYVDEGGNFIYGNGTYCEEDYYVGDRLFTSPDKKEAS